MPGAVTTLLWLALGVLGGLIAWAVPVAWPWVLVALALAIVGVLLPRRLPVVGAKIAIGTGATYLVLFSPRVISDPGGTTGETYLWFGLGLVTVLIGVVAVLREYRHQRRQAKIKAAEAVLS